MDVIVTPVPGPEKIWTLTDRLGRAVGEITRSTEDQFIITAAHTGPDAPLAKMSAVHPSLDAAMNALAKCLKGVCQLSSMEDE
jgi:hypothetical protein